MLMVVSMKVTGSMADRVATVFSLVLRVSNITETGSVTYRMVRVKKSGPMAPSSSENSSRARRLAKASSDGLMDQHIRERSLITSLMDMEPIPGLRKGEYMRATGLRIECMDKALLIMQTAESITAASPKVKSMATVVLSGLIIANTVATTTKTQSMAMESLSGQMAANTSANGKMESNMVLESTSLPMENVGKANGTKASLRTG